MGIDLEYTDYPGGTGAMTKALNEDSLDVALLLTEGCVKDIASGGNHKIVAVYVQSSLCWGVHTGAGQSDVQATADLDGKVWAVSRMTSGSHLMAVVLAKQQGWDYTQLKYEIVGNLNGAQEALTSGKANGFLWEKFTTKPLVDSGVFRRVGMSEHPRTLPAHTVPVLSAPHEIDWDDDICRRRGANTLALLCHCCSKQRACGALSKDQGPALCDPRCLQGVQGRP